MPKSLGKKLSFLITFSIIAICVMFSGFTVINNFTNEYKNSSTSFSNTGTRNAIKTDTNGNTVTDSSILSVSKVLVTDHYENEIINNDTELHNPNDTQNTTEIIYVNENDIPFVMLDTSASLTSPATREAVYIEFGYGPSNAQVKLFSSSIKLNGQNIATNNFIYPDDDIQAENQYFRQYIHGLTPTDAINGSDQQGSSNSPLHYSYKTYTLGNNVSDKGDLTFGTEINNIEGLYEIELQYRLLTDGQDYRRLAKFKFYLITENTYNQINESTTFNYTEKIDNTKRLLDGSTTTEDTPYSKQHYFKFTNIYTSVVTGGTFSSSQTSMYTSLNAPTVLMYPTLTYNPEKYKISYTKTLYNKQESYDLSFNTEYLANQTERGVLTITKTYGSTVTTERLYYTKNENGYYEVTLTFDEVGEYVFDKTCILRTGIGKYVSAENILLSDMTLTLPESLSIVGFQATYTSENGDVELKNSTFDVNENDEIQNIYTSDFSFLNPEMAVPLNTIYSSSYKLSSDTSVENQNKTSVLSYLEKTASQYGVKMASTNQVPIKFIDNASLNPGSNTSWYLYYNSKGVLTTTSSWSKSVKFESAGTYIVYISFQNPVADSNASGTISYQQAYFGQVFVFSITNTPPSVKILTTNSTSSADIELDNINNLAVNGFTNKNVYLSWSVTSPFNANITATYSLYNFNSEAYDVSPTSNTPYYGLVFKDLNGTTSLSSKKEDTTVCTRNGIYTIKIYYTNSKQSSLSFSFTIDKQEISGIKALEVNPSSNKLQGADENSTDAFNLSNVTISSLESFTLTTTKNFIWTWDNKKSGASITAQYTYASINAIDNFLAEEINYENQIWVTANGQFSTFAPLMTYKHTIVTAENANQLTFLSTQICTTPRLGLLLLSDSAGNKAIFITIFEDVTPEMIQQAEGESPAELSVISKNTKFTWGTHKALSIVESDDKSDVTDIVDNENPNNIAINYSENFSKYNYIINSLNNYMATSNDKSYITVEIEEASFKGSGGSMGSGSNGSDPTTNNIVFKKNGAGLIEQTFLWVVIDKDNHRTYLSTSNADELGNFTIYPNTEIILNANSGETGEENYVDFYTYTINLKDISNNQMPKRDIEINFDKSLGTFFSHYGSVDNSGVSDETYLNGVYGNRARLQQYRSTNRQFVTFSFRQQESGSDFEVQEVYLYFYPLDTTNTESENYPYSDEPMLTGEDALIYKLGENNPLFRELTINGETYYHSYALQELNYSSSFGAAGSQDGKYVFVRKYKSDFVDGTEGDVKDRTYTYYVDRGKVLTGTIDTGSHLTFGFEKGSSHYGNYSEYGGYTFSSFENGVIEANEFANQFKPSSTRMLTASGSPVVSSNILPIGLELPYATSPSLNIDISNKYMSTDVASDILQGLVDNIQSSNLMVLVQYFNQSGCAYQALYSHFIGQQDLSDDAKRLYNIKDLTYAFSSVGSYRVFVFDLSNINGTMEGTFNDLVMFEKGKTFRPNYCIINFQITANSPSITFEQKTGSSDYVSATSSTKSDYVRLTFTDTTDEYSAKIAYNDVTVTRTLYSILNSEGTTSKPVTISNPIYVTNSIDIYKSITGTEENPEENAYSSEFKIIYSSDYSVMNLTLNELLALINASYSSASEFTQTSNNYVYLKTLIEGTTDRYAYYLYLPPTPEVDGYEGTQMDARYTANYQYIGDNTVQNLYKVGNSYSYFASSSSVYIDHTSPYKNLKSLIESDKYLQATGKTDEVLANLYDLDYDFLKNYAFAVSSDYSPIQYDSTETDSVYFVRGPYDKFDTSSNEYKQTVVEGMTDYDLNTGAIKFVESNTSIFSRYSYPSIATIVRPFTQEGYYDIIERDAVENYRVYTVYVKFSSLAVEAKQTATSTSTYYISELDEGTEAGSNIIYDDMPVDQFGDTSLAQSISAESLLITKISTSDRWFTIKYRNIGSDSSAPYTVIDVMPTSDINSILASINESIEAIATTNRYLIGSKIEFVITNRVGNDLKFYIKTPGQKLQPTFTQINNTSFYMTMPMSTAATQIVSFSAKLSSTGTTFTLPEPVSTNPDTYILNYLTNGNYIFTFTDNFGYTYIITYPVDTSLIKELVYSEGAIENYIYNGIIHTLEPITLKYQSNTFRNISVKITDRESGNILLNTGVVNVQYFLNNTNSLWQCVIDTNTGLAELKFISPKNTYYLYDINIDDGSISNAEQFIFAIYTYLPEINLTDTSDVQIWQGDNEKTTSKDVKISWNTLTDVLFSPYVTIEYPSGQITNINSGFVVTEDGVYTIRIGNALGLALSKSIEFTIQSYDISIFGAYYNGELLTPHPNLTTYTFDYTYDQGDIYGTGTVTLTKTVEQYFFYSANTTTGWRNFTYSCNEDKDLSIKLAATLGNTRIYRVWGTTSHTVENFYAVTLVPYTGTVLTTMTINDGTGSGDVDQSGNSSKMVTLIAKDINHYDKHAQDKTCEECAPNVVIKWSTSYTDNSYSTTNPFVYSNFIYLDLYFNGELVGTYNNGEISLSESGTYSIRIRNFVNQQHMFNVQYPSFTLTILYEVIYLINNETPIQNAVYNNNVTLNLHDVSFYTMTTFSASVYLNNVLQKVKTDYTYTNNIFTFTKPGVYRVSLKVMIRGEQNKYIYGEANFTILNANETRTAYEVTKISGYEITSVLKQGDAVLDENGEQKLDENGNVIYEYENITSSLLEAGQTHLYSTLISKETTGIGKFIITITTEPKNMTPSQNFTFNVWINDETPILNPSREFGSSSTASVTISYNNALIYQQIGACSIVVNGTEIANINETNSANTNPQSFTLSAPNTYYVQVYSESGFLVMSQRITINEPLNTASIILIVVAILVVVALTVTFVLLRTKMRVK